MFSQTTHKLGWDLRPPEIIISYLEPIFWDPNKIMGNVGHKKRLALHCSLSYTKYSLHRTLFTLDSSEIIKT